MSGFDRGRRHSVLEFVDHASSRVAATHGQQLKRGLGWLVPIASTSFLIGIAASMGQMETRTFYSCGGNWGSCVAPIGGRLSFALGFGAVGLLLSCVSFLGYRYLTSRVELLQLEMETARLQLLNDLSRLLLQTK